MKLAAYSVFITSILLLNSSLSADEADGVSESQENVGDAFSESKNNDSQIQAQLQNSIKTSYGRYRITPHVFNGNVILTGQVYTEQEKENIGKMAQGTSGVKKVTNQIQVRQLTRQKDAPLGLTRR